MGSVATEGKSDRGKAGGGSAYIDFHTHHPSREGETVVRDGIDTWGAHPWNLQFPPEERLWGAMAIGECGLDRLCSSPYAEQMETFRRQIRLSEQLAKTLILHCVRAVDDVLRLQLEEHATQPWIFHAFRGKPEQMKQLLRRGMYVSFGFRHNVESLAACPVERLLLETDEDPHPVRLLYEEAARLRHTPPLEIGKALQRNYQAIFSRAARQPFPNESADKS